MCSLLCTCNVYRRCVANFALLALQLNQKLKKGARQNLEPNDTQHGAVDRVKETLITPPV